MFPSKISVEADNKFKVVWNDKSASLIKLANLRRACPCAECAKAKEEHSSSYIPIYSEEELTVTNIDVVGSYAINIGWADGHNKGLYEFSHLKSLAEN